jgi:hypothetical protein
VERTGTRERVKLSWQRIKTKAPLFPQQKVGPLCVCLAIISCALLCVRRFPLLPVPVRRPGGLEVVTAFAPMHRHQHDVHPPAATDSKQISGYAALLHPFIRCPSVAPQQPQPGHAGINKRHFCIVVVSNQNASLSTRPCALDWRISRHWQLCGRASKGPIDKSGLSKFQLASQTLKSTSSPTTSLTHPKLKGPQFRMFALSH